MTGTRGTIIKLAAFAVVMVVLTVFLFFIFSQYRTGSTNGYSAVFNDVSRLKSGQTVRIAGVRVGTVKGVSLRPDKTALVKFDADRKIALTSGTRAVVRYLNLTGDRYLELIDGPGSTRMLPAGAQIPVDRTAPALDLDLLLGGLKPVIAGLNAQDVSALSASLVRIFQGEGGTLESLLSKTSSFSNTLADNDETVQQLIDHLNTVAGTLAKDGDKFSGALDRLQRLISGLSEDRDQIGAAITSLDNGTASIADLLTKARPPLAGTVEQLSRLAPSLEQNKDMLDASLQKLPKNYRKLVRLGSQGSWLPYYLCELSLRVSDLQFRTVVVPLFKQEGGRCTEPSEEELRANR
jgi:phospholipid/cholesterol/gamma-HCH transport system substrate-binding protein